LNVTVNSASAVLMFRNNVNSEMGNGVFWDGGVLEFSDPYISNGDFLDVTDSHISGGRSLSEVTPERLVVTRGIR
jgi:hypothetical protein